MAIKVTKTSGAAKIDQGQYFAVVKTVSVETPQKPTPFNPDCDPFLKWSFRVYKPRRDGVEFEDSYELAYLTTMKLTNHPKNKLNNLLKALGIEVEDGVELDLESAQGKKLQIVVQDEETERGVFSKVVNLFAAPKTAPKTTVAAPKATAPKAAKPAVAKPAPAPAPVEEPEDEDVPPPETADDDLGDIDKWASLEN